jgi:lipopolysaccharide export system protein LptC
MANFIVQRFAKDGTLRTEIEGDRLRHFPDTDTLEVDRARIRAIDRQGIVTVAVANKALANGDGSEVQLLGDARVTRPAHDGEEQIEFRGEFLQAFRNVERVRSHLPVVVTQGASMVHADGMEYDNLARVVDLMGHTRATFVPPHRSATP